MSDLKFFESAYKNLGRIERVQLSLEFWGINIASAVLLKEEIFKDFCEKSYGVRWWAQYSELGQKRRILISDYLHQCCIALESSIVDAKVHLLKTYDYVEKVDLHSKDFLKALPEGEIEANFRPFETIEEYLDDHLTNLHIGGFFTAVGTVLDCLSSMIIGVLGFPDNLFKCGFGAIERARIQVDANNAAVDMQKKFFEHYDDCMGTTGWLRWAHEYRHMRIHRGRLTQIKMLHYDLVTSQFGILLCQANGAPQIKTRVKTLLPREPDISEVEVMRNGFDGLYVSDRSYTLPYGKNTFL